MAPLAEAEAWFDTEIASHPADLYRYDTAADGVSGLQAVRDPEVAVFRDRGFLVVHDAFNPAQVQDALDGILDLIAGKVPDFRGVQFEGAAQGRIAALPAEQRQDLVRKMWLFVGHEPRLTALAAHPPLLDVLARLIGDTPVLFQDQAMLKPPLVGREKPWHQDNAYFNVPPETPVVGVWIALDPATAENGCMHVIPGSHREGPVVHWKRRDWQICDTDVDSARDVMAVLRPGGCLFFHGLLHHGTPANRSAARRRALQFHYRPEGAGAIRPEARMAVFGSEGKDVRC